MKKHYLLLTGLVAISLTLSWEKTGTTVIQKNKTNHFFTSGGQVGKTGAPMENNCTECHAGTVQDGTTQNNFTLLMGTTPVNSYVPGQTYTMTLALTSGPSKGGFSATALDGTNTAAGTFVGSGLGGTQNFTGGGRNYVSHTSAGSVGTTLFAWSWVAPATDVGPVRVYIASNAANNNGQDTGDQIYTSIETIGSTVGLNEANISLVSDFNASFSSQNSMVYMTYSSLISGETSVNVVDLNGRSVYNAKLGASDIGLNKDMIRLPEDVKNGMYLVHFFVDNVASSKSILVQK